MGKYILYIDSMQKGGAQRVMSIIAEYLDKRDEVILVNDIVPVPGIPEYSVDDKIRRVFLDEGNEKRRNKNLHRVTRFRKLIKQERPDAVLSFLGPPNLRLLVAAIGLRTRKIVSVRNDPNREYGAGLKKWIARRVFLLADFVVFQTAEASNYFGNGVRKKSAVIANPISDVFFQNNWTGKGKNIIAVGRLQPQKNYALLLRAFSQIADIHADVDVDILGEGNLKEELISLCKELGIHKRVHFYGIVSNVPERLANSKLFVMTSDYEGMPNALMEAMAIGVPVVSTDCPCGGPQELTEGGKYGVLVPCGDVPELADALGILLSSEERRMYYHTREKEKALEYRTDSIMQKWYKVLVNE